MDKKSIQVGFFLHFNFIFDYVIFSDSFMGLWCNCLLIEVLPKFHNNILVKKGIYSIKSYIICSINISHLFIGNVQIPPISITKAL
jgi:hypothetical protein